MEDSPTTTRRKKGGFGGRGRRRAVINRNSKPKPITRKPRGASLLRQTGLALAKRNISNNNDDGDDGTGGGATRDIVALAEEALQSLTRQNDEAVVWRDSASKVYDGDEGRDQYWTMFRTGRRMGYGKRGATSSNNDGGGGLSLIHI